MNSATPVPKRSPTLLVAFAPFLLALSVGDVSAAEETLECRLYMGRATEITDRVEPTFSPVSLGTLRRSAVCVFADGRIAEKQFVEISAERDSGAVGTAVGYSVYGFENGDTLMARFDGGWGADGYSGEYEILSGTGRFEGASGDGTITSVASEWKTTEVVDIVLNVTLPD